MSSMCARLWPAVGARPAARVRRWRPRTKEACSCTHGTTSSIEGRGGRSPARSGNAFRELGADPYTTTKDLDFPEGPVLLVLRIAVPFSGTQTRIHFCNGALRRRPPTQLPHSVRTCATSSHLAHAPPHHGLGHSSYPFGVHFLSDTYPDVSCVYPEGYTYPDVS